jgi:hypothetical protein
MDRLQSVLEAIDRVNAEDPVTEHDPASGTEQARCLLYGQRMSQRLAVYRPDADECLQIAVRGQHIQRWVIPRSDYPEGRQGYHRWRRRLYDYHAELVDELMAEQGYEATDRERAASLVRKQNLKTDADAQTLEDVAAQVFLEHYLAPFMAEKGEQYGEAKLHHIIRRTWQKMSPAGQEAALELSMPPEASSVVHAALAEQA